MRAFGSARVLLVGDLILDRYIYGDAERTSPEAPVPVLRAVQRDERVGGCANVAACLRALHTQVICCGAVGRDSAGERLCALLTAIGVDTEGVLRSESRPTITKTRLIG
ncbi:MAG TPA: PfkB family carbohydrate kinase, partial [Phycisphaerae bacterium]